MAEGGQENRIIRCKVEFGVTWKTHEPPSAEPCGRLSVRVEERKFVIFVRCLLGVLSVALLLPLLRHLGSLHDAPLTFTRGSRFDQKNTCLFKYIIIEHV